MTNHNRFASHPRVVWVLVLARAVNRLGAFTLPFLGLLLTAEFGATVTQAGLVLTLFGLAAIVSRLVGGQLADRLGRRSTIVAGLIGCAVAQLWIAAASGLTEIVLAVALLGLVFELYEPPSQAIIADVTAPADRAAAYGLLGAALAAAGVVAGLLATWLGHWDLRWLFVADAVSCLACAVLVALAVRVDPPAVASEEPSAIALPSSDARVTPWRDRQLLAMLGTGVVFATIYLQLLMVLPLAMARRELPASGAGVVLTVSAVVLVAGLPVLRLRVVRSADDFRAMAVGYTLLAAGLAGNAAASSVLGFAAAAVLWSAGDLLLLGRAQAIVAGLAPEHSRGRYLAAYGSSWGIAGVVAPLAGTGLLAVTGPGGLWLAAAALALLLAVVQPRLRAQRRSVSERPIGSAA